MRYGIITLFLITAVALFLKYTKPYYDEIKFLKEEKASLSEALNNSRELQVLRDDLLAQYNGISQSDVDRLNKILPSKVRSDDIIVLFEDRARARGFLLKRIDVREMTVKAEDPNAALGTPLLPYGVIDISFSASGSYASFLALLADFEKSLQLVDVKSISFSAAESDVYEFSVNAAMYALSPDASTAVIREKEGDESGEILAALAKLRSIKIDTEFFKNEVFGSLTGFFPEIEIPADYGRPNPFRRSESETAI